MDGGAALAEEELNARERQELASGASPGGQESDDDGLRGPAGPGSMRQISMLHSCRPVEEFNKLNRISEGTYGVVYRCVTPHWGQALTWQMADTRLILILICISLLFVHPDDLPKCTDIIQAMF